MNEGTKWLHKIKFIGKAGKRQKAKGKRKIICVINFVYVLIKK
jgi:hypothetical protein